jgi:endo-alpha-1,4-polygalactosaminidase (GH114 family)
MLALTACGSMAASTSGPESTTAVQTTTQTTEKTTVATVTTTTEETTTEQPTETTVSEAKYAYGVFLSVGKNLNRLKNYEIVVIDAQNFKKKEIQAFRAKGHKVYSYINIGSLENFRSYYKQYKSLKLGKYEHWDEEIWINVADKKWQNFIVKKLMPSLLDKGIDGFFVDNCDVYYHYKKKAIMNGLTVMMKAMVATGKKVLINGGDCYLDAYCKSGGKWSDVITGINQETVFSKIIWNKKDKFGTASNKDHKYFTSYIERYAKKGADIYLLEYTRDKKLISKIKAYCKKKGFGYYVSDSVELD